MRLSPFAWSAWTKKLLPQDLAQPLRRRPKAEAGMQPLEILTAATKTNAEFFGVADRQGTIEAWPSRWQGRAA